MMNRRTLLKAATLAAGSGALHRGLAASTPDASINGDDPMAAAEYLSTLEITEHIPALYLLYDYMHPDAKEIVNRATVIGWYQQEFQPLGPSQAVATEVTMLDEWSWDVTGSTYSNVAEVTYTQEFENAPAVEDVVRLVKVDRRWCWFFGRDAAFVDEQIERFDQTRHVEQADNAPFGMDGIDGIEQTDVESRLPKLSLDVGGGDHEWSTGRSTLVPGIPWDPVADYAYVPPAGQTAPLATVSMGALDAEALPEDNLAMVLGFLLDAPPCTLESWNATPENGLPWAILSRPGAEMTGTSETLVLCDDTSVLLLTAYDPLSLQELGEGFAS